MVGDIHGRDDLLIRMHAMILADARERPGLAPTVVYLGDYVDRGSGSFEVLEFLIQEPLPGFTSIHLMGNHEDMMLRFLDGPPTLNWLVNGGVATLCQLRRRLRRAHRLPCRPGCACAASCARRFRRHTCASSSASG